MSKQTVMIRLLSGRVAWDAIAERGRAQQIGEVVAMPADEAERYVELGYGERLDGGK